MYHMTYQLQQTWMSYPDHALMLKYKFHKFSFINAVPTQINQYTDHKPNTIINNNFHVFVLHNI